MVKVPGNHRFIVRGKYSGVLAECKIFSSEYRLLSDIGAANVHQINATIH
jgi:hypothetical protein